MARARVFVAVGDSFTEGLHDDVGDDGRYLGWADRVARALARQAADAEGGGVRYANLAVRGRLLDEVVDEQVPAALAMDPDLVSFHAGGNDVLRPKLQLGEVVRRYERAVERLVAAGCEVVLFTALERAGGTGRLADSLAGRFARFNLGIRRVAQRHGTMLADVGSQQALQDRRLWHEDRLHLAPEGHRRVAAAVLETLGVDDPALTGGPPGWWREPLPAGAPVSSAQKVVGDLRWVRHHLVPWIGRRVRGVSSGDALECKHPEPVEPAPGN